MSKPRKRTIITKDGKRLLPALEDPEEEKSRAIISPSNRDNNYNVIAPIELDYDEYHDICEGMEWKFSEEKVNHIKQLRTLDLELKGSEDDFTKRWGYTKENLAIFRYHSDYYASYYDSYDRDTDNDGGFDDRDIIRKIQNGDGDMYGY